jgi:hypothetical protein
MSVSDNDSTSFSSNNLKASFMTIYTHLHEKHYVDRLVHALYVKPDHRRRESKLNTSREESARIAFGKTRMRELVA